MSLVAASVTCWHSPFVLPARHTYCVMLGDDLSEFTVRKRLKAKLRSANLPVSGRKAELVARLGAGSPATSPAATTIDEAQDRDGKCRAWLEEQVALAALWSGYEKRETGEDLVEKRMEALRAASEAWRTATPLPVERDRLEAGALLSDNRFLDECHIGLGMDIQMGGFGAPVSARGSHVCDLMNRGENCGDTTGRMVVLWNEAWASPEQAPKLRVGEIDLKCDSSALAPSFRDWLRYFASIPIEQILYIEGTDIYDVRNFEDGWKWPKEEETSQYLDDNGQPEDDDAKRSIALMEEGHQQLLDFLTKVWGVGPVSEDEVRGWKVEMRAQDEALEALVLSGRVFRTESCA